MIELIKGLVTKLTIGEQEAGQRIDNFLVKCLKGVPKSRIYRLLRNGELRVNSKRVTFSYRLQLGDRLRIPPVRVAASVNKAPIGPIAPRLSRLALYEDDALLAIDKPAGVAVHGGSGISRGCIEQLRLERPDWKFLELVHRLDRDTSGVLLLAKKRAALTGMHRLLREGQADKRYLVLVKGQWRDEKRSVRLALHKFLTPSGERRVAVKEDGQSAHTIFRLQQRWEHFSLLEAELKTGRTHQIRVHLSHLGFPLAGDDKYGDFQWNKQLQSRGLKRMFLHAWRLSFQHPVTGERLRIEAPLPEALQTFLKRLDAPDAEFGVLSSAD